MRKQSIFLFISLIIISSLSVTAQNKKLKSSFFGTMRARHIGPAVMSGRIASIDASEENPLLVYVGAASGGLWKSTNGGTTFKDVFEDEVQIIGAVTVDQNNNDVVWVGTGEPWTRNSISVGNGVYKSDDGGEKWKNVGLDNSNHIAEITINPVNSDEVYVAALGNVWAPNEERGVFKTSDGGTTWRKILFVSETTGCSDLAMDPENPNVIYAGMWDFQRKPYTFRSGGAGSNLYRTTDGGVNWELVVIEERFDDLGRISVEISQVDPNIIYAVIESEKTGLYQSIDRGESWELKTTSPTVGERPFYFSLIVADPIDTNRIYKPGFSLNVSEDGGYSFTSPFVEGGRVHSDHHALWINPNDNKNMYLGTDGGLYITYDKGSTWLHAQNLPLSQFYHVSVDNQKPYNVYGGLQDNGSWVGPSESVGRITNCDWLNVGYGDGFNVLPDPKDENILYWQYQGGNIMRFYKNTREIKEIRPFSDNPDEKLRYNWDTPITFSPTNDGVMYAGAQYLFRTTNRGDSWEKISPDLTTNDPQKQKQEESGGITIDNSTAENHCSIYTISESPLNSQIIWVGTDDGNLQVTINDGESWNDVTSNIDNLPQNTWCSKVSASNFDMNTAYVVFDGHRNGDKNVYVFKTTNLGENWTSLANNDIETFGRTITEDYVNPNLLFLGTDYGLYITIDGGKNWIRFEGNVPKVPIYEIVVHPTENDLVIGTHGRGILILDDITPLRLLTDDVFATELTIFPTEPYTITNPKFAYGISGDHEFRGSNPSSTALITYYLQKRHIFGDMSIEIYNSDGELIKNLPAGKNKGINRVEWGVRKKRPKVKASSPRLVFRTAFGPTFPPGDYKIVIKKGENTYEGMITLKSDPESGHSEEDMQLQISTLNKSYDLLEDISFADRQVKDLNEKLDKIISKIDDGDVIQDFAELAENLERIHTELVATSPHRLSGEKQLAEKVGDIYAGIINYSGKPTESQIERLNLLEGIFLQYRTQIDLILTDVLNRINSELKAMGMDEITVITREDYDNS
ncbi:MAG: glycosyl hydrolase [Ignavibacteriaceae bacterium]|nr:glycosyl hydrolase [Ignavibacteria bacterium]NNJ53761.1 glycosyl hydrolase [Ignavibacteriaceae bacterium]